MERIYIARGTMPGYATGLTPREAGRAFFAKHDKARKCDVIQAWLENGFVSIHYGNSHSGGWPESWKGVTKKTADTLPGGDA